MQRVWQGGGGMPLPWSCFWRTGLKALSQNETEVRVTEQSLLRPKRRAPISSPVSVVSERKDVKSHGVGKPQSASNSVA